MKRPPDEAVDNSDPCHSNGAQATLASHGSGDGVMANDATQSAIGRRATSATSGLRNGHCANHALPIHPMLGLYSSHLGAQL